MSAKTDRIKGTVKETAGKLTGNDDLKADGGTDRHAADIKDRIDHAAKRAEKLVDRGRDALHKK